MANKLCIPAVYVQLRKWIYLLANVTRGMIEHGVMSIRNRVEAKRSNVIIVILDPFWRIQDVFFDHPGDFGDLKSLQTCSELFRNTFPTTLIAVL